MQQHAFCVLLHYPAAALVITLLSAAAAYQTPRSVAAEDQNVQAVRSLMDTSCPEQLLELCSLRQAARQASRLAGCRKL